MEGSVKFVILLSEQWKDEFLLLNGIFRHQLQIIALEYDNTASLWFF